MSLPFRLRQHLHRQQKTVGGGAFLTLVAVFAHNDRSRQSGFAQTYTEQRQLPQLWTCAKHHFRQSAKSNCRSGQPNDVSRSREYLTADEIDRMITAADLYSRSLQFA